MCYSHPRFIGCYNNVNTVMSLSFRTDRSGQIMQIQTDCSIRSSLIRAFTICYSSYIFLIKCPTVWLPCLNLRKTTAKFVGVQKFRNSTVFLINVSGIFAIILIERKKKMQIDMRKCCTVRSC